MTQHEMLLKHFGEGKSISQLEAGFLYRIQRLTSRICELKDKGHNIISTRKYDELGRPYVRYEMVQ